MREELELLHAALVDSGDVFRADLVADALRGDETSLREFLVSNSLWGGAGSIADEGGSSGGRAGDRRRIESALVRIGDAQMLEGLVNVRTAGWVEVFRAWQRDGI